MKWRDCELGDVITLKRGHDLPSDDRIEGEVPVVSSSGITGYHNVAAVTAPGVVTGRYGTLGEVFFLERDFWPLNTSLYVVDFKGNDPKFTSYFLKNALRDYQSDKAAVPGVDRNVLHRLRVRVPDRESQETLARHLSAFDDLIDNNRRRMQLLEEAMRLVFEEWFVRGDRPTRSVALGNVATKIGSGATPRGGSASYSPEGVTLIRSQNIYDNRFDEDGLAFIDDQQAADLDNVSIEREDILLNITGASVGRCCMAPDWLLPARVNQHVAIIRVDPSKMSPYYVLAAINCDERKRQLLSYAQKGATREALTKQLLEAFEIPHPNGDLLKKFDEMARPMGALAQNLGQQNRQLQRTRDLLLPRLMSGELAV